MANKKIYKPLPVCTYGALWVVFIPELAILFSKPFIWLDALYYFLILGLAGCITTLALIFNSIDSDTKTRG
jgi:hypothetical protein